jgi:hypothetical protein
VDILSFSSNQALTHPIAKSVWDIHTVARNPCMVQVNTLCVQPCSEVEDITEQYNRNNRKAVNKYIARGSRDLQDKFITSVNTMTASNERKQKSEDQVYVLMCVSSDQDVQS